MNLNRVQPTFKHFAPDAPRPASTVVSRASAANRLPHPPRAAKARNSALSKNRLAARRVDFAEVRPVGFLAHLISESQADARRSSAAGELSQSISQLLQHAEKEEWSQRELARRVGIPERSFRRLRAGQVDALAWLPKLKSAAARTKLNCPMPQPFTQ